MIKKLIKIKIKIFPNYITNKKRVSCITMSDLHEIFDRMIIFMRKLSERKPVLKDIVKPFFTCTSMHLFLAVMRSRDEMKPLLSCVARDGSDEEQDEEINKPINVMFLEHNLEPEQFQTEDIDKIKRYMKLWAQVIIDDDGSDSDE